MIENQRASTANQVSDDAKSVGAPCEDCAEVNVSARPQYIYSIGKIDVRFPSLGIEREFQQRERQILLGKKKGWSNSGERLYEVLSANPHIARVVCYVHLVGNIPAYVVAPAGLEVMNSLISAVRGHTEPDLFSVVIGKRGPMATPMTCAGVLAPMMACDQVYTFTIKEFIRGLLERTEHILSARNLEPGSFEAIAEDVFRRIASSLENLGAQDGHRALNYLLVQHPGVFIAVAERANTAALESIETRVTQGSMSNRVVTVIFSFVDRAIGVTERLFCRVDVTEEWPFFADVSHGGAAPLGSAT